MYELIKRMNKWGYSFSDIKCLIEECCGKYAFPEEFVQVMAVRFIEDFKKYGVNSIEERLISINNFGGYENNEYLKDLYKEWSKQHELEKH